MALLVRRVGGKVQIWWWEEAISVVRLCARQWSACHRHAARSVGVDIDQSVVVVRQLQIWMGRQAHLLSDVVVAPTFLEEEAAGLDGLGGLSAVLPLFLLLLGILQDFAIVEPRTLVSGLSEYFASIV